MSDEAPFGLDPDSRELWWLTQTEPSEVLALIEPHEWGRKWWLFVAACLRSVESKMPGPASRSSLELVEACATGHHKVSGMRTAEAEITAELAGAEYGREVRSAGRAALAAMERGGLAPLFRIADMVSACTVDALKYRSNDYTQIMGWLRDIFGNPFRPVTFSPLWRTDTAIALAKQMYEAREFSAMPILADALQDAGCDNPAILDHCRDASQVHVRGCWVTDLVLGKS